MRTWKTLVWCLQGAIAFYCIALIFRFVIWPVHAEIKRYVDGALLHYPPTIFTQFYKFSENEAAHWLPELRAYTQNQRLNPNAPILICDNIALNGHGLCNRLNHLVSCAMTAVVLNRRLVVHWNRNYNSVNWRIYDNSQIHFENMHIDPFSEIFQTYEPNASFLFLDADDASIHSEDCVDIDPLHFVYIPKYHGKKRCLKIIEHYLEWFSSTPFFDKSQRKWDYYYAAVAKYFFQPKYDLHHFKWKYSRQVMANCRTVYQRRTRWNKPFPTLSQMKTCLPLQLPLKNRDYVLTDIQDASLDPISHHFAKYCRGEYHCDSDMLHVMYQFSSCSSAVVTQNSTFGLCIVHLGSIQNAFISAASGTCSRVFEK